MTKSTEFAMKLALSNMKSMRETIFDDEERMSSCCGYPASDGFEDAGICGQCREHCEYLTEQEFEDSF